MDILFYLGVFLPRPGGVPRNTHKLITAMEDEGVNVRVFAPREEGWEGIDPSLPYPVHRYFRSPGRLLTRLSLLRLASIYKCHPFQLIHCHGPDPAGYCSSYFKTLFKVPYILTPRRSNLFKEGIHPRWKWKNHRVKRALRKADMVTALSSHIRELVAGAGVDRERIALIPHGIDPDPFVEAEPVIRERPYLLSLGRFVGFKGFDLLVEAFSRVAGSHPWIDLVIAGDGPLYHSIKAMVEKAGLSQRVILPGRVEGREKRAWYKGALAFVLPSYPGNEGFPNVLLEAMAAGLPIIATRVSGSEDVVVDQKTGYLVMPCSREELAGAIGKFLSDPAAVSREEIASRLEDFNLKTITRRYMELYSKVIGEARSH